MKGTIHFCLEECIIEKYGKDKWQACLLASGLPAEYSFDTQLAQDVDEELTMSFIVKSTEVLGISLQQLFDDFGYYWSVVYAPKVYGAFYAGCSNTKDMVLKLSHIHMLVGKIRQGAKPPQFEYTEIAPNQLQVTYLSDRDLFDLYISLVKGLDAYFKNETTIEKINERQAILTFSHF